MVVVLPTPLTPITSTTEGLVERSSGLSSRHQAGDDLLQLSDDLRGLGDAGMA